MYPSADAHRFTAHDHLEPGRWPTIHRVREDLDAAEARGNGDGWLAGFARATAEAMAFEVDSLTRENERLLERIRRFEGRYA